VSAIKYDRTPGLFERIGSALVPIMATALVLIAVSIGAASVVFMAIGIESVKAIAASVLCVGALAPTTVVATLYIVQQRQTVAMLVEMVRTEPVHVVAPEPRQLQPPQWTNGVDRWTEVAPGHLVDAGSLRVMAERVYDQLWGQGRELTQANIKQVVPVSDNSQCTAICNDLAGRGLAYKESDAKTARWKWVREYKNG